MLPDICQIAKLAGTKLLEYYADPALEVRQKADESPVTAADLAANDIIVDGLKRISQDIVISEENWSEGDPVPAASRFWLVDPLDGTKGFVEKRDHFVVSIALIENLRPKLGVIYAPVFGEMFAAEKGRGATCNGRPIFNRSGRKDLIAVASQAHPSPRVQKFVAEFGIREVKRFSSALKFCRLAQGDADVYPRFGTTSEWDTAAGHLIATESGCRMLDMVTKQEVVYGKPGLRNNGFVAARADLDFVSGMGGPPFF